MNPLPVWSMGAGPGTRVLVPFAGRSTLQGPTNTDI